jgi:hypothetical protein
MKKVLIFGCSYSAGSYEYIKSKSEWKLNESLIKGSPGWYSFVDHFNDCKVTVLAIWGEGYWFWYQYIDIILNSDFSEYDEIWFQETAEPRNSLVYPEDFEIETRKRLYEIDKVDNFEIHQMGGGTGPGGIGAKLRFTLDIGEGMRRFLLNQQLIQPELEEQGINVICNRALMENIKRLRPNSIFDLFTKACANEIDNICKRNNIKGYVWSMSEPVMECKHLKRIKGVEWVWRKFDQSMFSLREDVAKQIIKNMNYYQDEDIYTDPGLINLPLLNIQGNDKGLVDKYMSHQNLEGNKFIGKLINEQIKE